MVKPAGCILLPMTMPGGGALRGTFHPLLYSWAHRCPWGENVYHLFLPESTQALLSSQPWMAVASSGLKLCKVFFMHAAWFTKKCCIIKCIHLVKTIMNFIVLRTSASVQHEKLHCAMWVQVGGGWGRRDNHTRAQYKAHIPSVSMS